ncbi:hypothetical protein DH2020_010304 [Rehmannia glutinosa]|uniref:HMG box domain-containing protein n=1 Tax=Rehmannia glutinosa TaxID=99300 RepID=A0ABR0XAA2_REHGL
MAYQSRARKRVHAIRRGPDGSAFQKCESCGVSVPIALYDMHECEIKENVRKKLKSEFENGSVKEQRIQDLPRSAFRFFMEEFTKTCNDGNEVEIDKKGIETWKTMTTEERRPFVLQANKVNSAYDKLLHKEEREMQWVDDEADSAEVGKYDKNYDFEDYESYYDSEGSDEFGLSLSDTVYDPEAVYALAFLPLLFMFSTSKSWDFNNTSFIW